MLLLLIGLVLVALFFDFMNGRNDAANSIATIVSTRVLRPRYAVIWAAFFNFIAFLFFGLHVAQTVGVGIVDAHIVDARVIFGALMGAVLNAIGSDPDHLRLSITAIFGLAGLLALFPATFGRPKVPHRLTAD